MKKAGLLKMKQFAVSKNIVKLVEEDTGEEMKGFRYFQGKREVYTVYRYYRYYMAEVENKILKVGIFTRKHVAAGQKEPDFTIYIDKKAEEWTTYSHSTKKWLTGMIINLPYDRERGEYYSCYGYCTKRETKIINRYLGIEGDAKKSIRIYQSDIRKKALEKRHRSEMEQIDEVMGAVPEMPADFKEWTIRSAYKNNAYMIYNISKKQEGYCTHCKNIVKLKDKPKHNERGKCPRCRAEVTYKSRKKQRILKDYKKVGIIQPLKDKTGYILRVFHSYMIYTQEKEYKNPKFALKEESRFRLNKNFYIQEIFEYGEYKYTGVERWCHERKESYYVSGTTSYCTLYEKNIDKLLENTEGKYVPLKQFLQKYKGIEFYAEKALITAVMYPEIEKIMKAGLERLAFDLIRDGYTEKISYSQRKLEDMLKLDKYYVRIAVEMNADVKELTVIQSAYLARVTTSKELLKRAMPFLIHRSKEDNQIFWNRGKCEKTIHYFEKIHEKTKATPKNIARDYEDYMGQLEKLRMPLTRSNRFPQHFYETHAELAQTIEEKENIIKKMEIKEKNRLLKKQVKALRELYYINSKEYVIVFPQSKEDFEEEGRKQHNCVGGYFEKMVQEQTTVFFLRKKEEPEKPFCTAEFTNGKLRQCRTACNKEAPENVMKIMKQIESNYQKAITKKMLEKAAG